MKRITLLLTKREFREITNHYDFLQELAFARMEYLVKLGIIDKIWYYTPKMEYIPGKDGF